MRNVVLARQIDERLLERRTVGLGRRRLSHHELVEGYLEDLRRRADAEEIMPAFEGSPMKLAQV